MSEPTVQLQTRLRITKLIYLCSLNKVGRNKAMQRCRDSALPGYYAASSGNCLPMFRENLSVSSSRVNLGLPNSHNPTATG